jgi:hypothetical protein
MRPFQQRAFSSNNMAAPCGRTLPAALRYQCSGYRDIDRFAGIAHAWPAPDPHSDRQKKIVGRRLDILVCVNLENIFGLSVEIQDRNYWPMSCAGLANAFRAHISPLPVLSGEALVSIDRQLRNRFHVRTDGQDATRQQEQDNRRPMCLAYRKVPEVACPRSDSIQWRNYGLNTRSLQDEN